MLDGRRVIVTGSTSGIGKEIAGFFAAHGAQVVVNGRGGDGQRRIDDVVQHIRDQGGQAVGVAARIDDPNEAQMLIDGCVDAFGGIDVLINNAGIYSAESLGPVTRCSLETWHETLRANLDSVFYTCRAALPHMIRQRWGRVINAASFAGTGKMGGSAYPASKAGLYGLSKAMASEYGGYGITVNVYNPSRRPAFDGIEDKESFARSREAWLIRGFRTKAEDTYLDDLGGPEGIPPWIAYLCLDQSDFLNGRIFTVESRRVAMHGEADEDRILFRNFRQHGPFALDELIEMAPLAFAVDNAWPRRTGNDLAEWERSWPVPALSDEGTS